MKHKLSLKCACYSELLLLEYDKGEDLIEVSIWNHQYDQPLSIKDRIRYCWQILTKGEPYGDQIILNRESVDELVNFFLDYKNPSIK